MKKICGVPFYEISLYLDSHDDKKITALPCCQSWLKPPYNKNGYIGVKEDKNSNIDLKGTWNSDEFKEFRKSIEEGTYKYCDLETCPNYNSNNLQKVPSEALPLNENYDLKFMPIVTRVCFDRFCNLACPSCRSHRTLFPLNKSENRLKSIMRSGTKIIFINGGGELFANRHMLEAISDYTPEKYPDINYFDIITNGTLLNKAMWLYLPEHFKKRIVNIMISLDSCDKNIYPKIRRGADFNQIMRNIQFISSLKKSGELSQFGLSFVIQKSNIKELPNFIRFAEEIGANTVVLNKAEMWNSYGISYYEKNIKLDDNWKIKYSSLIEETRVLIKNSNLRISSNIL